MLDEHLEAHKVILREWIAVVVTDDEVVQEVLVQTQLERVEDADELDEVVLHIALNELVKIMPEVDDDEVDVEVEMVVIDEVDEECWTTIVRHLPLPVEVDEDDYIIEVHHELVREEYLLSDTQHLVDIASLGELVIPAEITQYIVSHLTEL